MSSSRQVGAPVPLAAARQAAASPQDDPDLVVYRETLLEEMIRLPGAVVALVIAGPEMPGPMRTAPEKDGPAGPQATGRASWTVVREGEPASGRTRWVPVAEGTALLARSGATSSGDVLRLETLPSELLDILPPSTPGLWLMAPAPISRLPGLILLVGLRSRRNVRLAEKALAVAARDAALLLACRTGVNALLAESEALRAENNALARMTRLQGDLAAMTSHELKTPLTSISAYTEVLERHAGDPDFAQAAEFLAILRQETARLLRVVDRMLDLSRLELGPDLLRTAAISLGDVVRETARILNPLAERKGLRLVQDLPARLPAVDADRDLVQQALINLVNNAIKYTPSGGTVTLACRSECATVRVEVRDTGPGIPAGELRAIFRQFYRLGEAASEEGSGLGLSIVKNIIALHHGYVDVTSRPGEGACFSFHLPRAVALGPLSASLLGEGLTDGLVREILNLCVRLTAELMEAGRVVLLLAGEAGDLAVQATLGYPDGWPEGEALDRPQDLIWKVLQSQRARLAPGAGDPLAAGQQPERGPVLAAAPLPLAGGKQGVLAVGRLDGEPPFSNEDAALLATLAGTVSRALAVLHEGERGARGTTAVLDALRSLCLLKQSAVPTATPLAFRLLSRTAARLGLDRLEVRRLQCVAALHDAGMVRVGGDILLKAGLLSASEREEVLQHPELGARLVEPLLPASELGRIIQSHHERIDGSGYPSGLAGSDIPLGARILAVVDAFFAMICRRPYRPALPLAVAAAELRAQVGRQFDPDVVEAFLAVLAEEGLTGQNQSGEGRTGEDSRPVAGSEGTGSERQGGTGTTQDEESEWQPQES